MQAQHSEAVGIGKAPGGLPKVKGARAREHREDGDVDSIDLKSINACIDCITFEAGWLVWWRAGVNLAWLTCVPTSETDFLNLWVRGIL